MSAMHIARVANEAPANPVPPADPDRGLDGAPTTDGPHPAGRPRVRLCPTCAMTPSRVWCWGDETVTVA